MTPNNIYRLDDRKKKFLENRRKMFQPRAALINDEADTKGIKGLRASDVPKGFSQVSQFEVSNHSMIGLHLRTFLVDVLNVSVRSVYLPRCALMR